MKFAFRAGRYTSWNFRATARLPPPSATVMNVKKHAKPTYISVFLSDFGSSWGRVPIGANISWSKATLFSAGAVPLCLVIGKDLFRKEYHLYCTGDIMKP